ncbi:TM2 domain-containing protein [Neolewinella agarilytica]|uniref:TM2 domain-containing protein n=1 Tax=Neolewinella agarilytica TaxID=478744 RepID=A0A1H9PDF4_9BACT|nr:TM2 domain-containing protein [Neolewinella agarilytica]SER45945.1 TM2 domain-containing protein [Neolewinella agarilytica]
MKRIYTTLLAVLFVVGTASAAFVAPPAATATDILTNPDLVEMFAADGKQVTMDDFLAMTPRSIREKTGERLGLKKAITLKMAQRAIKKQIRKEKKAGAPAAGGDKNQLVALLLAIFIGGLGIHSFYMGKTLKGIAQILLLLTSWLIVPGIALFAWILYDIITIAIGSQEPKDGSWNPEL